MSELSDAIQEIELATDAQSMREPIASALTALHEQLAPSLDIDSTPIQNSQHLVSSGGVYQYLHDHLEIDEEYPGSNALLVNKIINQNGIYLAQNDNADGYSQVEIEVPNTYSSQDEGKVVYNSALVSQTSRVITSNGTYDTTLNNEVEVDIPSGESDEAQKLVQLLDRTISGSYENSSVTNIGSCAFYGCASLTEVNFSSCTSIGPSAFFSCISLIEVSFPACTSIDLYAFGRCSSLTEVSFPACTSIGSYAFYICTSLSKVSFPACTSIGASAFYSCISLTEVSFPVCISIGYNAFYSCTSLSKVSFPSCTSIGAAAFNNCISLTEASFPVCTSIGSSAFYSCISLTEASFPSCISIGTSAFYSCISLTEASFPSCTSIGNNAFYICTSLSKVSFPACISIGSVAFSSCTSLSKVSFPSCTSIGAAAFNNCISLTEASFPACTYIESLAFSNCRSLSILKLLGSSVVSLSATNAFYNTPITVSTYLGYYGSIYVPESLYSQYISNAMWRQFSSRFVSVSVTT